MDSSQQALIRQLQQGLDRHANLKTKAWWEGYLKHAISFRGVKMADIRGELHRMTVVGVKDIGASRVSC